MRKRKAGARARRPGIGKKMNRAVRAAMARGSVPGAVVLIARDGRVIYHRAFGFAQIEPRRIRMRKDTMFDLASLTKPCATALALAILADEGTLSWRDRVAAWLPWFAHGGKGEVTLLDLATHTGGLDDRGLYDQRNPMKSEADALELLRRKELYAKPGAAYLYADLNYITLGKVVESAAGMPLDGFFHRRIARPLGLKTAGFNPPRRLWRRTAATERLEGKMLRGSVHDPRARDMGGVAGHAGLFATAHEVLTIVQTLMDGGGKLLSAAGARAVTEVQSPAGLRPRTLGWDTDPEGYGPRGDLFPFGGFGHTGFTGTSVWADPGSRSVVVVLSNRVHPDGKGGAEFLRRRIANVAAAALTGTGRPAAKSRARARPRVLTGADVMAREGWKRLAGKRIGLVTNLSAVNADGRSTLEMLAKASGIELRAVFAPEHGLEAKLDEKFPAGTRAGLAVPVLSLYGEDLRPKPEQLAGLDALIVDLPDIGARFYTYATTLAYCMEEAARAKIGVIVLDRPNPITGLHVEGPLLLPERFSFIGYASLPVRHGMTLGELALFFNAERSIGADLEVVKMEGWRRAMWFDETGLPWANPSPNIRTLTQAILYPAVGLLEATNLSVGRGTDAPFERFGAPWLDGPAAARELNARNPAGIRFYAHSFQPVSGPFAGEECSGCLLQLLDRDSFRPVETGIAIADVLARLFPGSFKLAGLDAMAGGPGAREALLALRAPEEIAGDWRAEEGDFDEKRRRHLLYR